MSSQIRAASIRIHSLTSRKKTLGSLREKAARKNLSDPIADVDDLVGLRVVCLLRSDINRLGKLVRQHFEVVLEDNKLDGVEVNAFGYLSVHFVVQLPRSFAGPRYEGLHGIRFEIQLRTLAMDAWASLSHYLDYKSEPDVPKELRKDFFALSGLFYVADTHFEMFYAEREKSKEAAKKMVAAGGDLEQELNLDTLTEFLSEKYPERRGVSPKDVSELIGKLVEEGYPTLRSLREALAASANAFARYEQVHPPAGGRRFGAVGVVRISLALLDEAYAKRKYKRDESFKEFRQYLQGLMVQKPELSG